MTTAPKQNGKGRQGLTLASPIVSITMHGHRHPHGCKIGRLPKSRKLGYGAEQRVNVSENDLGLALIGGGWVELVQLELAYLLNCV
jgi:hypothetical protein